MSEKRRVKIRGTLCSAASVESKGKGMSIDASQFFSAVGRFPLSLSLSLVSCARCWTLCMLADSNTQREVSVKCTEIGVQAHLFCRCSNNVAGPTKYSSFAPAQHSTASRARGGFCIHAVICRSCNTCLWRSVDQARYGRRNTTKLQVRKREAESVSLSLKWELTIDSRCSG